MEDNKELLKAQAHIWNYTFKYINSMSLKCIIQLGIPNIIHNHGQPMTLSNLLATLQIPPSKAQCLRRLMRLVVHSGFFIQINDEDKEPKYALTPSSRFFVDTSTSLDTSPFVLLALHRAMVAPWESMSKWLCSEDEYCTAFGMGNSGKSIWDYMVEDREFGCLLSQTMVFDSKLMGRLVSKECKEVFVGLRSMVDVGGGDGTMAKIIVDEFPHIDCIVFDLPHVVSNHNQQTSRNLKFVGGDMFETKIPPADAVLLKSVLHQWNDEESIKILRNCKEAICGAEGGGRVIIIDAVLENEIEDKESTETELCGDVLMMASFAGRKRDETEWKTLFSAAGFSRYTITSFLGLRSLIQLYP